MTQLRFGALPVAWVCALFGAVSQAQTLTLPATLNLGAYLSASTVTNCTGTVSQANCTSVTLANNATVTLGAAAQIVLGPGFTAVAGNASTSLTAAIVPLPTVSTVAVSPASVTSGGSATITVTLSSNAPYGGIAVALSSSNTAAFSPPASITVAAGQITGSATVTAGTVSASTSVTVTASYNNSTQPATVTVLPPPTVLTSVSVNPTSTISTNSATVTVTLSAAASSGGAAVIMSSSNTSAFNPPASITVAAGQTTGAASVSVGTVSSSTNVTVAGNYAGTQTGSVTVLPLPTVSALTISPSSLVSTASATITVTLSAAAPSSGAIVSLSSTNTSAFNPPASVVVAGGQTVGSVAITAGMVTASTNATVTASYNSSSQAGVVTVVPPPDFTIALTPTSNPATTMVGGSSTFSVAVSAINGFTGAVTLSAPGLPTGASASFSPATITTSGTSTMTVTAPASGTGNFTVAANGTTASLSHFTVSTLAVQDFTVTLSPYNANNAPVVAQGGTQTFTIATAGVNGYTGNIALNYIIGSPQCQLSNLTVPPPVAAGSAAPLTLTMTSSFTGYCFFQVSASANGDTHVLYGWLDVASSANFTFTLPTSQGTLTATPTTQAATVIFNPALSTVNNFCGTVNFQVTGLPTGASVTAPSVNLCANSPQTAQITVTVPPGTPQATSQLTVNAYGSNGNAGQASSQYIYPYLQVGSGGSTFSISASPPQTTAPGGAAQYTITVNGSAGLGNVTLTAAGGPPGATVQLGSASVAVGGQTTMTVTAPSNAALGTYPVKIVGMLGTVPRYATALTNIAQAAPASIVSPVPGTIPSGQTTFTWNSGIGATGYQLAVGSSASGANCSSAQSSQSTSVIIYSNAQAYVTLSSLMPGGACLAQSYVYFPSGTSGSVMSLGIIGLQPNGPHITIASPLTNDTITGCSAPFGVTPIISGVAGYQTVSFTASSSAQIGTTSIACSTTGSMTLPALLEVGEFNNLLSGITATQTTAGNYRVSITGWFGDQGGEVYVSGSGASISDLQWGENDIEFNLMGPDGVCGSVAFDIEPNDFDPSDDDAPQNLEADLYLCPDVAAPAYSITGTVWSASGKPLQGITVTAKVNGGAISSYTTDANGKYSLTQPVAACSNVTLNAFFPSPYTIPVTPNAPGNGFLFCVQADQAQDFTASEFTTVYLLHGIGQSHTDMFDLQSSLLNGPSGLDVSKFVVDATFDYSECSQAPPSASACDAGGSCTIANGAAKFAAQYIAKTPSDIVLVGYSMGGLIARAFLVNVSAGAYGNILNNKRVRGLVTLSTPSLGYPWLPIDPTKQCGQLTLDMAGSWDALSGQRNGPMSSLLPSVNASWGASSYGGYWLAAAGRFCANQVRLNTSNPGGPPFTGCPEAAGINSNDGVVCADSAWYADPASAAPTGNPTATFPDPNTKYSHTNSYFGFGTALMMGCPTGSANPQIFDPKPGDLLYTQIVTVINNGH